MQSRKPEKEIPEIRKKYPVIICRKGRCAFLPMNIGIDIDDTLTHTFEHFVPLVAAYFHVPEAELWEKNISCDNLPSDWLTDPYEFGRKHYDVHVLDTPFKSDAPWAVDTLRALGHRVVIITARTTACYTDPYATAARELHRAGIVYDKLVCSRDKAGICLAEHIDVHIDDHLMHCDAVAAAGIHVINMLSRANRSLETAHHRVSNWKEAVDLITKLDPEGNKKPFPSTGAILVLGHRLSEDGKPSNDLIRRVDTAAAHWKLTNVPMIIPCGGPIPGQAEVMRRLLIERGIPEEIIHPEDRSCTPIENLRNVRELLGDGKRVALVTSDYNVERALDDCSSAGLRAYAVGAITPEGSYRNHMYAEEQRITENRERN